MQPANMAYDRAITVFSPDGRLFQVEYAREAVKRGTTTVGIKYKTGVVLIVDKRITSRLVEPSSIEKIFEIDDHIVGGGGVIVAFVVGRALVEGRKAGQRSRGSTVRLGIRLVDLVQHQQGACAQGKHPLGHFLVGRQQSLVGRYDKEYHVGLLCGPPGSLQRPL